MVAKKKATKKVASRKSPAAAQVTRKKAGKKLVTKKMTPLVDIKKQLKEEADNIASKIGGAGAPKITLTRNKMFRFPDGRETPQIGVVIVDFRTHHLYYDKPYREGEVTAPVCFAIGENPRDMYPSRNGTDIQAEDCQGCPMNQFKSAGAGKACQNRRVLAVLAPDAADEDEMLTLSVSPTGLKRYDSYVAAVKAEYDMPPVAVITQVTMDRNAEYPTLVFGDPTPNTRLQEMFHRRTEAAAKLEAEPQIT